MALEWIHPDELRNHPTNLSIYGDKPDPELVESVRLHGVFEDHPIGYVLDGEFRVIVSGHRRNQAARLTKQEMVPCVRLKDIEGDELAIEERIILSNKQRVKTNEQKAREAAILVEIESKRAAAKKASTLKQNSEKSPKNTDVGTLPTSDKGKTRERVADALGVSDKTARNLITAGKALEEAEAKGQDKKAERIKKGLEKSAAAGAEAAKPKAYKVEEKPSPSKSIKTAGALLTKVESDFIRAADNLAPLVRTFDEIKAGDPNFKRTHEILLGHHSRLYQICEDGKRALKALKAAWNK